MSKDQIEIGSRVRMTSGGYAMNITEIDGDTATVMWFNRRGRMQSSRVPLLALELAPPKVAT